MNQPPRIPGTGAVDLSALGKSRAPISPLGVPSRRAHTNPYGEDVKELTPSERNEAAILTGLLMKKYGEKAMTEQVVRQFENEARSRFAEQLGLVVSISWDGEEDQVTVDADPNSDKVWFCPSIIIEARTDKHEVDFDQIANEVRAGEADGQPGVLRDGVWHEEARKKNVY